MKYYNLSFSLKLYGIFYIKQNQSLTRHKGKKARHIRATAQAKPSQAKPNLNQKWTFTWETKCNRAQQNTIEKDRINGILFAFEWSVLFGACLKKKKIEWKKIYIMTITMFRTRNPNKPKYVIFIFLSNVISNSIQPLLSLPLQFDIFNPILVYIKIFVDN